MNCIGTHALTNPHRSSTVPIVGNHAVHGRRDPILGCIGAVGSAVQVPLRAVAGANTSTHGALDPSYDRNNRKDGGSPANHQVEGKNDGNQAQRGHRKRDKAKATLRKLLPATGALVGLGILCERVVEFVQENN